MIRRIAAAVLAVVFMAACGGEDEAEETIYQVVPVAVRDIIVSAEAAGVVEPDTVVEVKSKASGEIQRVLVETGDRVDRGTLMVQVDPRTARNAMSQAEANLDVARARLVNAEAQKNRAETLYASGSITETEYETAALDYATAKAEVVRAEIQVQNNQISLEDTDVRAPVSGTIIERQVERGQVISSPTQDVGGGSVLMTMADLSLVRVRTLIDETDIGKIQPGMPATVTVAAYPERPFAGEVLKIEPQATEQQNVTMFPVLIRIPNPDQLLKPGMNAEVEVHIGRREGVLAVPNGALQTQSDLRTTAPAIGISQETAREQLAAASAAKSDGAGASADSAASNTIEIQGRTIELPEGVTREQVQAIFAKMRGGERPSEEEVAIMRKLRQAMGGAGRRQRGGSNYQFGGNYVAFVMQQGQPTAINVQTGLTDLDYSEVVSGLSEGDSVLVMPSAGLIEAQQSFMERVNRFTGGGALPGMRSSSSSSSRR